jgi:hypothetical protein
LGGLSPASFRIHTRTIMARLVVNPGSPGAWDIQLRPGVNSLGRGATNDFKLTEPSVSTTHCQIVVGDGSVIIKDLGSSNGTFVDRTPVQEAYLQSGQRVHLGGLEMMFLGDEAAAVAAAAPAKAPLRATIVAPRAVETARPAPVATAFSAPPPIPTAAPAVAAGSQNCKHHPKTPGRFLCNHCQHYFCDLCVTARTVGGVAHKYCRHCGSECMPVQVKVVVPVRRGFFSQLPGVFIYPFKGAGFLVLIIATLLFAALERLGGGFSILLRIVALGYLFSFMQTIIHSTAAEDNEMPGLPGMDDVFMGCLRLVGCVLVSFFLAIGLACLAFFNEDMRATAMMGLIPAILYGCVYFPMALLAVAMKDSLGAANPLVVVPAIFKAPLEYLVTVILLAMVFGIRVLGGVVVGVLALDTYTTRSMSTLLLTLGLNAIWSFFAVYLLAVNMRALGLLYVAKKEEFGWFGH